MQDRGRRKNSQSLVPGLMRVLRKRKMGNLLLAQLETPSRANRS
jgi:hypothetical protein